VHGTDIKALRRTANNRCKNRIKLHNLYKKGGDVPIFRSPRLKFFIYESYTVRLYGEKLLSVFSRGIPRMLLEFFREIEVIGKSAKGGYGFYTFEASLS
jgi:hypothetical protein